MKLTPEEEIAAYMSDRRPHIAVVEQKDGVIHTRLAPDLASANRALYELMLAVGPNFDRAYVRAR
jgi:hypothetical protein